MIVEIGGGRNPQTDTDINIDKRGYEEVDMQYDIENGIELPPNYASKVYAYSVLEHIQDLEYVMEEIHRILKPHGCLIGKVPWYDDKSAYTDPTHVRRFTDQSFDYWDSSTEYGSWDYFDCEFSVIYCMRIPRILFWRDRPLHFKLQKV